MMLRDRPAVELSIWEGAVVFDLRDYEVWSQGHIPGARTVTVDDLRDGRSLPEDLDAPVLFMGDGPMDDRAERAADIAIERGHTNVQLYPGGWRSWTGDRPVDN
jgi:rhodanese-related sulfurtransferase